MHAIVARHYNVRSRLQRTQRFWMVGRQPFLYKISKSFAWACGPPIDMKIKPSREYDQAGVGRQRSWQLWMK
jgi:hypothetical protein